MVFGEGHGWVLLGKKGSVLNGGVFLYLWHDGLSLEKYFVQTLWSIEEDFFLDQSRRCRKPSMRLATGVNGVKIVVCKLQTPSTPPYVSKS
jgi:hypothetical protein